MDTPRIRPEILEINRYIPGKSIDEVTRELGLTRVVKLASNENPLGPSPLAVQAIAQAVSSLQLYPDDSSYLLKRALATHFHVDEACLICGNGAVEIIRMLMEIFIESGDEVVLASPSFAIYHQDVKQMSGKLVEVSVDSSYQYDLQAMRKAVTSKTKMVLLCSPNNPTGTILTQEKLTPFLESLPPHVFVVLDEAYFDFVEEKDYPNGMDYVKQGLPLIVLRTFSKAYGLAGIRIGFGVASKAIAAYLNQVRVVFNVNRLAQVAAIAALRDSDHFEKTRCLIWEEKKFLYAELDRLGLRYVPTQSNFLMIQTGNDPEVFDALMRLGVIIRPGSGLGIPGWIRVNFGTREDNLFFIQALAKIALKHVT